MSGIYIPNAQIPQFGHRISVLSDGHAYYEDMKNPYLDLGEIVPVPDHGRLIDADALAGLFRAKVAGEKGLGPLMVNLAALCIDNAPTIIPADKEGEA